ncbi:choline dehydrogenase-like flavoprotein [Isoptericola jiangsuensis]|uniref:Choline dehydrogenase-like flavoprotein n=1 Tax=Isoptericola jiangsuensis TaxID=548579 RepID=A0A2A9EZM8_9MICO|nr:GMC family oxidoreductase [Isoptericola jiangsuensis]PFG44203.1 choline dehydrogenase-like flavoprotein [Isoptericola jiangsuensis]
MLVTSDAELPDLSRTDVCVVGGGAAGIALATELAGSGLRVVVLEEGGPTADTAQREAYEVAPGAPPTLGTAGGRRLFLGGNSNHWYGNCRPLDREDFAARPWIPGSGWPITRDDLDPHYRRAQELCGLGDLRTYEPDRVAQALARRHGPALLDSATLETRIEQTTPEFSLAVLHARTLRRSRDVVVLLGVHVTGLERGRCGGVRRVRAVRASGETLTVTARRYVLAAGGIENAKILLASPGVPDGATRDNVGRYFQEHWYYVFDALLPDRDNLRLYHVGRGRHVDELGDRRQRIDGAHVWAQLVLAADVLAEHRLPGLAVWFQDGGAPAALRALKHAPRRPGPLLAAAAGVARRPGHVAGYGARRLLRHPNPSRRLAMIAQIEQVPDPASRLRLTDARDPWGRPHVALDTRLDATQRADHATALRLAGRALGVDGDALASSMQDKYAAGDLGFYFHHTGTTRMGRDPAGSVVDRHCRVHGTDNLYVVGSSVFPTSGTAEPTLTVVALAARLADHLVSLGRVG